MNLPAKQRSGCLAAVLGHLSHMVLDQIGNKASHPMSYSILYRISHKFRHRELVPHYHKRMENPPYWAELEVLFWKLFAFLRIK